MSNPTVFVGNPTVYMSNSTVFVGNPTVYMSNPTAFIGNPTVYVGNPTACVGCLIPMPPAFEIFLDDLDELNAAVGEAQPDWLGVVALRIAIVAGIKARVMQGLSRVRSNGAWELNVPAVKAAGDNLRGYRPSSPKPPVEGEPAKSRPLCSHRRIRWRERPQGEDARHQGMHPFPIRPPKPAVMEFASSDPAPC